MFRLYFIRLDGRSSDGGVVFITQRKRSPSPRASSPVSAPVGRNGNSGRSLRVRSRLTSLWRRPDPPVPGPRGLQLMPSPYRPNYINWLPHGVTHGAPWPGRPSECRYTIHLPKGGSIRTISSPIMVWGGPWSGITPLKTAVAPQPAEAPI